jgi:hypothetical protein
VARGFPAHPIAPGPSHPWIPPGNDTTNPPDLPPEIWSVIEGEPGIN